MMSRQYNPTRTHTLNKIESTGFRIPDFSLMKPYSFYKRNFSYSFL